MRLLLDTQVLLWSVAQSPKLSRATRRLLEDPTNEKLFSAASIWEVSIKSALRRPDFLIDPARLFQAARRDFREVVVTSSAAIRVAALPHHHRDPFDRLLVVQALEEDAILLTADRTLLAYGSHVHLAA